MVADHFSKVLNFGKVIISLHPTTKRVRRFPTADKKYTASIRITRKVSETGR